ncbi:MAG: glycosyltransferase [Solirubrobacterales bacterium]
MTQATTGSAAIREMTVPRRSRENFAAIHPAGHRRAERALELAHGDLAGRAIWHVTYSSPQGDGTGVAEMLRSLLGYTRDSGLDAHLLGASADAGFRTVGRRIYHRLYGSEGDGGPLSDEQRRVIELVAAEHAGILSGRVRDGDIVFLHDLPGLVGPMKELGARVIWRSHLGVEEPNRWAREAWEFLWPMVAQADGCVFSRPEYAWEMIPPDRVAVLKPTVDPFSPKNEEISPEVVLAIVDQIGLSDSGIETAPVFARPDGTPYRLSATAEIDQDAPLPAQAPLALQISGWERLKAQRGLLELFADELRDSTAHLVIAGPMVGAMLEGAEESEVLDELRAAREALPVTTKARVHLVQLPVGDLDENAIMVNALQRRADVIVDNAEKEAFGLSIAEAMLKGEPILARRTGGTEEQIVDGVSGVLVEPDDDAGFAKSLRELLADQRRREVLGIGARAQAMKGSLTLDHLANYIGVIENFCLD